MNIQQAPVAKAELLIRKSLAEVFDAFVNPAITSKFWMKETVSGTIFASSARAFRSSNPLRVPCVRFKV